MRATRGRSPKPSTRCSKPFARTPRFAMRPTGHQTLANVYRICDLARSFELSGGISFRGFVEELIGQAEKADAPEALVLEEAADGVRLMTVHTAKGLEFPVVILADMTANLTAAEPDRYVDPERGLCATRLLRCAPWELIEHEAEERQREKAEGVRVAYVAATRARDLLVVPAIGDEERDGWLAPLNKAIYPQRDQWRKPRECSYISFRGGARCSTGRSISISQDEPSVKPGLHAPQRGSHEVLWWDPAGARTQRAGEFRTAAGRHSGERRGRRRRASSNMRRGRMPARGELQKGQSEEIRRRDRHRAWPIPRPGRCRGRRSNRPDKRTGRAARGPIRLAAARHPARHGSGRGPRPDPSHWRRCTASCSTRPTRR